MVTQEDIIRKIAHAVYRKLERAGISNTADWNWIYAEKVVAFFENEEEPQNDFWKMDKEDFDIFRPLYTLMKIRQTRELKNA